MSNLKKETTEHLLLRLVGNPTSEVLQVEALSSRGQVDLLKTRGVVLFPETTREHPNKVFFHLREPPHRKLACGEEGGCSPPFGVSRDPGSARGVAAKEIPFSGIFDSRETSELYV